jgi:hypothetical protein
MHSKHADSAVVLLIQPAGKKGLKSDKDTITYTAQISET